MPTPIPKPSSGKWSKQPASVFLTLFNQCLQIWHMIFLKDKTQTQFMPLPHILNMCMRRFNAVSFVCVWFGAGVAVCGRVVDSGLCGILARV